MVLDRLKALALLIVGNAAFSIPVLAAVQPGYLSSVGKLLRNLSTAPTGLGVTVLERLTFCTSFVALVLLVGLAVALVGNGRRPHSWCWFLVAVVAAVTLTGWLALSLGALYAQV